MATQREVIESVERRAKERAHDGKDRDLWLATYSPGDGKTRYRFFTTPGNSYFGPANGTYTALGASEASAFLSGWERRGGI